MKKITVLFAMVGIITSCTPKLQVPLAADNIPLIGDAVLIQNERADKKEVFIFSDLKHKGSRKKYIDSISMLNNQVLEMYKQKKITVDQYNNYETASQALADALYFLSGFIDSGATPPPINMTDLVAKIQNNPALKQYQAQLQTLATSSPQDPFVQLAEFVIAALKQEISQMQHP